MKKMIAIVLALVLCISALSVVSFAAFEPDSMAIVGANIPGVDAWDPASATGDMTEVETGIWVKEIVVTEAVTMTIKFAGNDAWDDNFNFGGAEEGESLTVDAEAYTLACGPTKDLTLEVTEPCTLKFTLDLNGDEATVKVETVTAGGETDNDDNNNDSLPVTGDLSIAAVSVALLAATAGMVLTISKKKEF